MERVCTWLCHQDLPTFALYWKYNTNSNNFTKKRSLFSTIRTRGWLIYLVYQLVFIYSMKLCILVLMLEITEKVIY